MRQGSVVLGEGLLLGYTILSIDDSSRSSSGRVPAGQLATYESAPLPRSPACGSRGPAAGHGCGVCLLRAPRLRLARARRRVAVVKGAGRVGPLAGTFRRRLGDGLTPSWRWERACPSWPRRSWPRQRERATSRWEISLARTCSICSGSWAPRRAPPTRGRGNRNHRRGRNGCGGPVAVAAGAQWPPPEALGGRFSAGRLRGLRVVPSNGGRFLTRSPLLRQEFARFIVVSSRLLQLDVCHRGRSEKGPPFSRV